MTTASLPHDFLKTLEALDFWTTIYEAILYFVLAIVVGLVAAKRGRGPFAWFLLAFFTTPLLAVLSLLLFPSHRDSRPVSDKALRASIRKGKVEPF